MKRIFTPFTKDGKPVRALFKDTVAIVPAEKWLHPFLPFPQVRDWNSVRVHLERGRCRPCIDYSVDIRGDGDVEFDGGSGMMIPGRHHGHISQQAVRDLVSAFQQADYFSLLNEYVYEVSDARRVAINLGFDGHNKSVLDYAGIACGIPDVVDHLENTIDRIAETAKWTQGNAQTGPALLAENWNFKAITDENRALFTNAAAHRLNDLVQLCLDRSGQVNPLWSCSLEGAAASGDLQLVRLLLQKGINPNNPPCGLGPGDPTVLMNAARSGNAQVVREILKHHPNVNEKYGNDQAALALFLQMARTITDAPTITRLLIAAGGDVNNRDPSGRTPIFYTCGQLPELVDILAKAGAGLNTTDNAGETPLMACFNVASVRELLSAGADPNTLSPNHLTIAQEARNLGATEKAVLLESAAQEKSHP